MTEKKLCVYRHLKPNGEVFYIGIGSLSRPYNKTHRNNFWKKVVEKYPDYEIQILKTDLTKEDACELEQMLVAWYGRRDCCGGTLVNLTDGGEATQGRIMEEWQRQAMSDRQKGTMLGDENPNYGNSWTEEQKLYMSELKKEGYKNGTLKVNLDNSYKGIAERNKRWEENPQLKKDMIKTVSDIHNKYEYLKLDRYTREILEVFQSRVDVRDKYPDIGKTVINSVCNGSKKTYRGFIWRYRIRETGEIIEPVIKEDKNRRKVICTLTYEIYESITALARLVQVDRRTLNAKLIGKNPNDTPYIYLDLFLEQNPDFYPSKK